MNDATVYFPSVIGLFFGIVQLALKVLYGSGSPEAAFAAAKAAAQSEMMVRETLLPEATSVSSHGHTHAS